MMKYSYLYILASRKGGAIYTGVTSDLIRRVYEHREKLVPGHTAKYNIGKLVWYGVYEDIEEAIRREKQMKAWKREWKTELIEKTNPEWKDLYDDICK